MVEKVDRPDAQPPWRITAPKESREDQHQQQDQREEQEKRYQKQLEGRDWKKFGTRTVVIKPMRVPRGEIDRCLFRAVAMRSGIGTLQAAIRWRDGQETKVALILLRRLEDFLRVKKLAPGAVVPEDIWGREETVEIGIPQIIENARPGGRTLAGGGTQTTGERSATRRRAPPRFLVTLGLLDGATGRIRWGIVLTYLMLIAFAIALVVV